MFFSFYIIRMYFFLQNTRVFFCDQSLFLQNTRVFCDQSLFLQNTRVFFLQNTRVFCDQSLFLQNTRVFFLAKYACIKSLS